MEATPGGYRLDTSWFTSRVLANNPLGDPAARQVHVLLPPGYDENNERRYPTLYGLSGFLGRGVRLLYEQPWQPGLLERLDNLHAQGMPPVIVVLPDCLTRLGGSQYLNSPAVGRYEDYVADEIVPYVDARYATMPAREGRGVFGKSSGGYGTLTLGMHRPQLFSALACHSGDMGFDAAYITDILKTAILLSQAGGVEAWLQQFEAKALKDSADFTALNVLAMAACYSPDASQPLGIALPFDLETCTLNPSVWARWQTWDPVEMLDDHANALRDMRLIYLDCGWRDEFYLFYGARRFVRKLEALGIAHEYQEFDGGHMNIPYRYDISLPKLAQALSVG